MGIGKAGSGEVALFESLIVSLMTWDLKEDFEWSTLVEGNEELDWMIGFEWNVF